MVRSAATHRKMGAFTLIELLIAIAIVAILVAVAIPSYTEYVTRSNRAEGRTVLLVTAQALERCYTRFSDYSSAGGCTVAFPITSENGTYIVTASTLTSTSFTLSAAPQGAQETRDTKCATLTYTQSGVRGITGTGTVEECW